MKNKVIFDYRFTSEKDSLHYKMRKDVSSLLNVSTVFKIYINEDLYFEQEEFPILEFYKYLYKWKIAIQKDKKVYEFHYYSIEHDEYEEGAIISLIPFGDKMRLKSIWAELELYNVFELDYLISELIALETRLKRDLENYFQIELDKFIKHIPSRYIL
ncbi:hypothetical protein BTS2_1566 [Bacillus sp. TS-2]|nr:hypothetical protein BTS2_1566 [Bacillus sp. TS-2]